MGCGLRIMFYGNAVLWKGMEKSRKSTWIFPHLTHNTWKSREKSPTFPHSHKTFSLRSLKCGKTKDLDSVDRTFSLKQRPKLQPAYKAVFFHIPTISGYFFFIRKIGKK
jgi:hypothetical protein